MRLAQDVEARGVPGAIVECGVLDGGTAALMALCAPSRKIHLFDSWQGLPETTAKDGPAAKVWAGDIVGSQRRVKSIMTKLGVTLDRVHFHKGWFEQTFQKANVDRVALLHIDADFYESVRLSIETWFLRLSSGGHMQFDDYGDFIGCTRAVDEFLLANQHLRLERTHDLVFYITKPSKVT